MSDPRLRRISIDKFYEIITGQKDAFVDLCKVLPTVIKKVASEKLAGKKEKDTVFKELKTKDKNMLKALYLLAFETYEGFDAF
ncbi:MAG: Eco47II family restriction endonuclease [Christensenellaceae bacterium]|nr:Eco47II family restriction endonuclease [Christensenellaceae bacterium]